MESDAPISVRELYERDANRLLREGLLGHGVHEDLLLGSASWFDRTLVEGGGAFGDFFRAALARHVTLACAVDLDLADQEKAADLHAFLQVVLRWLQAAPEAILRKSPEPLSLIVADAGTGHNCGAQILQRRGPSLIYWSVFRSLRRSLNLADYEPLAEEIRQTLVHEMIGHQLAFCTSAGPLIPRDDLRDILNLAGIHSLKLVDVPSLDVAAFLNSDDLLAVVRRIDYLVSRRKAHKYYSNLTELIAFAVEGGRSDATLPYGGILHVLKRRFLCAPEPLKRIGSGPGLLFEGYDFSSPLFPRYFMWHDEDRWCQTEALSEAGSWRCLAELIASWQRQQHSPDRDHCGWIEPGQPFFLQSHFSGFKLEVDGESFLVSPFGLFTPASGDELSRCAETFHGRRVVIEGQSEDGTIWKTFVIRNDTKERVPFKLVRLDW